MDVRARAARPVRLSGRMDLEPGVYEELITRRLRQRIDELIAEGRRIREARVDPAEEPDVLARHVRATVERVLDIIDHERRVEAANTLLRVASALIPGASDLVADRKSVL
jgi:hypothetical protein